LRKTEIETQFIEITKITVKFLERHSNAKCRAPVC